MSGHTCAWWVRASCVELYYICVSVWCLCGKARTVRRYWTESNFICDVRAIIHDLYLIQVSSVGQLTRRKCDVVCQYSFAIYIEYPDIPKSLSSIRSVLDFGQKVAIKKSRALNDFWKFIFVVDAAREKYVFLIYSRITLQVKYKLYL